MSKRYKNMKKGAFDHFQTPLYALTPLLHYLPPSQTIWEPACGKGNIANALVEAGHCVIRTDIGNGHDFRLYEPPIDYDLIVTNPPYTSKNEFLARCYELGKPFALLLPYAALGTPDRQNLYRRYGLQVLCLPFRVHFETPSGREDARSWFDTAWFTSGLELPSDLTFWQSPESLTPDQTPALDLYGDDHAGNA